MSEFAFEAEAVKDPESMPEHKSEPESQPEQEPDQQASEPGTLTLSVNDFSALENRILRAVEVVRRERQARTAAEERAASADSQLKAQAALVEQLEKDLSALRTERDHVRERVDRLLGQLDALEL
jgi:plasmid replication initiation protein